MKKLISEVWGWLIKLMFQTVFSGLQEHALVHPERKILNFALAVPSTIFFLDSYIDFIHAVLITFLRV